MPVETVVEILSFLSPKELVKVALLNSDYAFLAGDDQLWKPLCLRWGILNGRVARHPGGTSIHFPSIQIRLPRAGGRRHSSAR